MKKIVGILAASAVLASSVFAADVAAKVKLTGSIINYDVDAARAKGFDVNRDGKADPMFTVAIDDTTVGAKVTMDVNSIKKIAKNDDGTLKEGDSFSTLEVKDTLIWFKPLDMLKVSVGNTDPGLSGSYLEDKNINSADRLYWKKEVKNLTNGGPGYQIDVTVADLTISGFVGGGAYGTPFFGAEDKTVQNARVKVAYANESIGNIAVLAASSQSFARNFIGAEYKNDKLIDGLGVMAQAGVDIVDFQDKAELGAVDFLASAKYVMDALTIRGDVFGSVFLYDGADNLNSPLFISVFAKVEYALGNITPYFFVAARDITEAGNKDGAGLTKTNEDNSFRSLEFKPGVAGTFGLLSWDAAVSIKLANDMKAVIDVPVEFSVAF